MEEKTQKYFWDDYWSKNSVSSVNYNFSFDRCLVKEFKKRLTKDKNKSILEIGCAPGKWLVFFNKQFGYFPSGIDYSSVGVERTEENFRLNRINGSIRSADIFQIEPENKYDIVISLGFIEHFEKPIDVVKKHIEFLKDDGLLILGVPNFRGLNYYIQKYADKHILDKHNTNIDNISHIIDYHKHNLVCFL